MEKLVFFSVLAAFLIMKSQIDHIKNGVENFGNPYNVSISAYERTRGSAIWVVAMLLFSSLVFVKLYINEFSVKAVLFFVGFFIGLFLINYPMQILFMFTGKLLPKKPLLFYFRLLQMLELFMMLYFLYLIKYH